MKSFALVMFAWFAIAAPAAALERGDIVGTWESQWANRPGEPASAGGDRLVIALDTSADGLDGFSGAPGMDGVMNGEIAEGPNGSLIWTGQWASVWRDTTERGTFRFVFTDAHSFTGTWSTADGEVQGAAWNGARAH